MATGALVVKTQDGNTYFIREEILDACKVADDELEVTDAMVAESGDVEGFGIALAQPVQFGPTTGPALSAKLHLQVPQYPGDSPGSTVMCCW